ncbi:MAG: mechanosensitive ion channel domain-containing protein [Phormidesmis sp.]
MKERHNPQRIARLVIGAVLSFTVAIALPFIVAQISFPNSLAVSDESAPVVVDNRTVFRVSNAASVSSAAARAQTISKNLQQFAQAGEEPKIDVAASDSENLATVRLGFPTLEDPTQQYEFTVTPDDTTNTFIPPITQAREWATQLEKTFAQASEQRESGYIQRHLWQIPVVPFFAAIAHWLAGILWRDYLAQFLRSAAMDSEPKPGKSEQFTTVNIFLNATLFLLRLGIWIGALLYVTNLFPRTRQISYQVISQLTETFTNDSIPLGSAPVSILDLFRVLALVLLVAIAARITANLIKRKVLQETGINRGVQEAISILLHYSLMFVGAIVVLQASGINLSSLTILASALGVGAGLGLQNIVKDIGSGLVLVFERPVQVGEFVQIGEQMGTVERIGARSTEIRTVDQVSVIVPNSQFLENEVVNWSHRNPISRIRIPIGVSYKADPEIVRQLLLRVGNAHPEVLATPLTIVLFCGFGESALQFELLVWIAQPSHQFVITSDLRFMLSKALHEAGISIPYPQRDVHVVWDNAPLQPKPQHEES